MDSTLTLVPADAVSHDTGRAPALDFSPGLRPTDPVIGAAPSLAPTRDPLAPERSRGKRIIPALAGVAVAVVLGAGGTLAWQSYGGNARTVASAAPAAQPAAPAQPAMPAAGLAAPAAQAAPSAVPPDLMQQLESIKRDVATARRGLDQLTANQEQMAQTIAKLQATEQDILRKLPASHSRPTPATAPQRPAVLGAPPRSLGTLPAGPQPAPQMSASPLPPPQTVGPPR